MSPGGARCWKCGRRCAAAAGHSWAQVFVARAGSAAAGAFRRPSLLPAPLPPLSCCWGESLPDPAALLPGDHSHVPDLLLPAAGMVQGPPRLPHPLPSTIRYSQQRRPDPDPSLPPCRWIGTRAPRWRTSCTCWGWRTPRKCSASTLETIGRTRTPSKVGGRVGLQRACVFGGLCVWVRRCIGDDGMDEDASKRGRVAQEGQE